MENKKPKIEEWIDECLDGENAENALNFVTFLRQNKMSPIWYANGSFSVTKKSKRVCIIKIQKGEWIIWSHTNYNENFNEILSAEPQKVQEKVCREIEYCFSCSQCRPGKKGVIMGKEYQNICIMPIQKFKNPNIDEVEFAKKLVFLRRTAIDENKVPKNTYIAIKNR